jgi:hypothetical protein
MTAVAWTAIGLLGATLAVLAGTVVQLGARIDGKSEALGARIDTLGSRIERQGEFLGSRIERQGEFLGARIDALAARTQDGFVRVNARIDEQSTRIDALSARLDAHLERHIG